VKLSLNLLGGLFQLHLSPEGVFSIPYVSESFIKLMAHQTGAAVGNPNNYLKYIHLKDIQLYIEAVKDSGDRPCHLNHRFRYQREDDTYRWLHITATPERQEDGGTIWHGHVSHVTIQCENECRLQRLAYNDALTSLPRRAILDNSLPAIIERCDRKGEWAAVLLFELDGVKLLNDRHVHDVGDAILVEAANRLECNTLDTDFVYR
jgi:GGDEF domain-containing protein